MHVRQAFHLPVLALSFAGLTNCGWVHIKEVGSTSGTGGAISHAVGGAGGGASVTTSSGLEAGAPWPMLGHDPMHTSRSFSTAPAAGKTSWTLHLGKASFSSPVIAADGTIYVTASDGRLHAVNPDGTERWSAAADNGGGIKDFSAAAIAKDGSIYVGNGMALESIDSTGAMRWSLPAAGVVYTSPAVGADGTVYFTAADDRLHAVTSEGKETWATLVPGVATGSGQPSSPAIGPDGTVYVVNTVFSPGAAKGTLFAVRPDGKLVWSTAVGAYLMAGPVVGNDGTIYVGTQSWLRAVAPDGNISWTAMSNVGVTSTLAIGPDGVVYAFDGGFVPKLHAVAPDGTERWEAAAGSTSAPVVGSDGSIFLTADDTVFSVHADGTLSSSSPGGGASNSPPAIASDGTLIFAMGTSLIARSPN